MLVKHSVTEPPHCLDCFADLSVNFIVQRTVSENGTTWIFEGINICKLSVSFGDSWCKGVGV